MNRLFSISIILIMCICFFANAKSVKINYDDALFLDKSGQYRWEFYYSFEEKELVFVKKENQTLGEMFFHIKISSNLKVEVEKKWIISHIRSQGNLETSNVNLYGQKDFLLNPGQYKVEIYLQNLYDTTSYSELKFDLIVRDTKKNTLTLSSIELAQELADTNNSSTRWNYSFIKHQFYVVPLPTLTFSELNQKLNSYVEFYHDNEFEKERIVLEYRLKDTYNQVLFNELIEKDSNDYYNFYSIPLINLSTGIYFLEIKGYLKSKPQDSVFINKKFFLLNHEKAVKASTRYLESQIFEKSEFSSLTPDQTEIEILKIKPIASVEELEQFKLLSTTDAKQRMLFRFWQNRDIDSTNDFNESLFKFKDLVKYSQNYFTFGFTPGWMTDRGRTVIKYGLPGTRQQHPSKGPQRAYEEWFYEEIQGGVFFYFVDTFGNGNYELVHSTAFGEIQYENWYNEYVLKNQETNDERDNNNLQKREW